MPVVYIWGKYTHRRHVLHSLCSTDESGKLIETCPMPHRITHAASERLVVYRTKFFIVSIVKTKFLDCRHIAQVDDGAIPASLHPSSPSPSPLPHR